MEDFGSGAISLSIKALLSYEKSSFYIHERKQETEMIEDKICGHLDQIGYFVPYQRALWDLFEKPQSSHCAKLISLLSTGISLIDINKFFNKNKSVFYRSCFGVPGWNVPKYFQVDEG